MRSPGVRASIPGEPGGRHDEHRDTRDFTGGRTLQPYRPDVPDEHVREYTHGYMRPREAENQGLVWNETVFSTADRYGDYSPHRHGSWVTVDVDRVLTAMAELDNRRRELAGYQRRQRRQLLALGSANWVASTETETEPTAPEE